MKKDEMSSLDNKMDKDLDEALQYARVRHNIPAFPTIQDANDGMTLRDWFAGMALCGILADSSINATNSRIAISVYDVADEMLKARQNETP